MRKILRDNLVLRSLSDGVKSDAENLPTFFEETFGEDGDPAAPYLGGWIKDLVTGHPTTTPDDIWVVVDPAENDKIVSALLLIPQTWQYEGIEFPVGRVELVATNKDYRRRGLVRKLMDVAHERSQELGHIVQGITGIPYFYRQFGYAMAINLDSGVHISLDAIPDRKANQTPDFTLRKAISDDLEFMQQCNDNLCQQSLVSAVRDTTQWEYQFSGQRESSVQNSDFLIIESAENERVGFLWLYNPVWDKYLYCAAYALADNSSYLATFEDVMRGLKAHVAATYPESPPTTLLFDSGMPEAIDLLTDRTSSAYKREHPYAWYVRVPSLAAFINQIKSVLEGRLKGSGANQFTGTLQIDFYERMGLQIIFEKGILIEARDIPVSHSNWKPDAAFPFHLFLNVIFGHRDYFDLRPIFPDVWVNRKAIVLLSVLFPKKRSWLVGIA